MATMETLWEEYNSFAEKAGDERTVGWPSIRSPVTVATVMACYIYFCVHHKSISSKWVTWDLKPLVTVYNVSMVVLSFYMMCEFWVTGYYSGYSLICQPMDTSRSPTAIRMASAFWLFHMSKYIELIETFLFALRKRYRQITFLHCFHHSSMLIVTWATCRFAPGGHMFIFAGLNCFVHTVMYTYYGISALGKHMQKYLWWKRYMTMLQLVQFLYIVFFCINLEFSDCGFPDFWISRFFMCYCFTLTVLFMNFFLRSYVWPKVTSKQSTKKQS